MNKKNDDSQEISLISADYFGDQFLKDYIHRNGHIGTCSLSKKRRKVVPFEDIYQIIRRGILKEYDYANHVCSWNDTEGSQFEPKSINTHDLVFEEISYEAGIHEEVILEALNQRFENEYWSNLYSILDREFMFSKWTEYCKLVKECEDSFSAEQIMAVRNSVDSNHFVEKICSFLDEIYSFCRELDLIEDFRTDESFFRCVNYLKEDFKDKYKMDFIHSTFLGAAVPLYAGNNRMNEQGDSMFYGSNDIEAALLEVNADSESDDDKLYTVGEFNVNKKIKVLDLYKKIGKMKTPSLFDIEQSEKREICLFMKKFSQEISKEKTDEGYYRPTQVLTKYFQRKNYIKGIRYGSAKKEDVCNIVFFISTNDCVEAEENDLEKVQLVKRAYSWPQTYNSIKKQNYKIL